jgi:hypothetical protein
MDDKARSWHRMLIILEHETIHLHQLLHQVLLLTWGTMH